ncbi:MAG: hypothetical protein ABIC40_01300 [bacterium]
MHIRHLIILTLTVLLAFMALACGGGNGDPVNNNNNQNPQNTSGATITGRVLDRERTPQGAPFVTVKLKLASGAMVSPAFQPASTGPQAGLFTYLGAPVGTPLILEIDLFQVSIGRNLGWIQNINLTSPGTYDLGDIILENDFLDNGWNAYVAKDYTLAVIQFKRAFEDRWIQSNLTYSSSAYNGLGWTYGKRGKDHMTGFPQSNDMMTPYEWDDALLNFDRATANPKDADAFVGYAGTYITLLGQQIKDPYYMVGWDVFGNYGPQLPYYAFLNMYFDEAAEKIDKALMAAPDYNCFHDSITANDLKATKLFLELMKGNAINPIEVDTLKKADDINQGTKQLLAIMPDLISYNPFPQL